MNAKEFSKTKINELVNHFPSIKCSYEHDKSFSTHYMQISPSYEFANNELLNDYLDDLFFDFIEVYPTESIVFLTEDSLINLTNIDYVIKGSSYKTEFDIWESLSDFKEEVEEVKINNNFEYELDDSIKYALAA